MRKSFSIVGSPIEYPDFLGIQVESFDKFFTLNSTPEERKNEVLYKVIQEHFPINDTRNSFLLEFLDYHISPPKYSERECLLRGLTYSVSLKIFFRLSCSDPEHEDFETVEQEVYLGQMPMMSQKGSFIFNGSERVIVSQLHRSPGVFFAQNFHSNGTKLYSARVIPSKGAWIEFTTDVNNVMYAYIDRKKKLPVTTLLRAIGFETDRDIMEIFGIAEELDISTPKKLKNAIGRKLSARVLKSWTDDFVDEDTGEVVSIERNEIIIEREEIIKESHIELIKDAEVKNIMVQKEDVSSGEYSVIYNTLQKDTTNSEKEAIEYIYRVLRSSEPPDEQTAREVLENIFFSEKKYDLGDVGRYRINRKLNLTISRDVKILTSEDITSIIKHILELINLKIDVDDIDHLSNRRVKTVGEQLYNQFYIGFYRMARTIRERMNVRDNEVFTPSELINVKSLMSHINSFFGTNQLSQFMDQTNPLAEMTHKRRLSALGQGGLTRERAGFEVRDVHYTHYGRLCPIETPEGPNIGLISSLCVYAKINELGFIETPYRNVEKGKVDLEKKAVKYYSAEFEEESIIAQANAKIDKEGGFVNSKVKARHNGDFPVVAPDEVDLMDIAPNQIASVAASLIPFLEHNDANRALMGSNMMRQSVPLLSPEAPIVGTGIEKKVANDSRILINAKRSGVVKYVDANKIEIEHDVTEDEKLVSFDGSTITYKLPKFHKTNQNTCINIRPIVKKGDVIEKGEVLCEGYGTEKGELAIGRNLKVAFMPWKGYNFEDAIVISERVVSEDVFTSICIDEYSLEVRETKLGMEEFTPDIPNVGEEATKYLDSHGIISLGAEIKPGDILIGKITPKGESDPTPEEKLLRAIFGDKAGHVKNVSMKAPPSASGHVIEKKLFTRTMKSRKNKAEEKARLEEIESVLKGQKEELRKVLIGKLWVLLEGQTSAGVRNEYNEIIVPENAKFTKKIMEKIDFEHINPENWTQNNKKSALILQLFSSYISKLDDIIIDYKRDRFALTMGDDLPPNIIKLAKVYVASKRKLKVGDKMAGRHGNKGVVAKIVRKEDMPFTADGEPVDIVLNPLGVPSRMNLGQIYETVLGWAGKVLGEKYATPIFDGASLDQINELTDKAGLPRFGRAELFDGATGEKFDQEVTVGYIYMIKLSHMIDDKMHARSIGPYSLITQQPLGGKSQFGGQRLGEMEVWAVEGYGAANILRELLTVKSDDIVGRAKAYESIVKGENIETLGIPESFNVLMHEIKGLGIDLNLE